MQHIDKVTILINMEGPTLLLNMTSYGHVDMMDQIFVDIIQVFVSIINDLSINIKIDIWL